MQPARIFAALILCLVLLAAGQARARDFFLSPGKARPQGYVMVAKGGAPFSSIQAALDSISDASSSKVYMVMVGPGVYQEQVTLKSFVGIMGAGQGVTVITQPGSDSATFATVLGADSSRLTNLTVRNTGGASYDHATAILLDGVETELSQVAVEVTAAGATNAHGIICDGSASPTIIQCSATVSGATGDNMALYSYSSDPELRWVDLEASGGTEVYGIYLNENSSLRAEDVSITVSDGDDHVYGICSRQGASFDLSRIKLTASSDISIGCYGLDAYEAGGILKGGDFSISGASSNLRAVMAISCEVELYHLNANVNGSGNFMYGMTVGTGGAVRMEHFSFEVAGGTTSRYGFYTGGSAKLDLAHGSLRMPSNENYDVRAIVNTSGSILNAHNVTVVAPMGIGPLSSVIGLRNESNQGASMYNCDLDVADSALGVWGTSGTTTTTILANCRISGQYGLDNMSYCKTYFGACLLESDYYVTAGNVYCFGCYDDTMAAACH